MTVADPVHRERQALTPGPFAAEYHRSGQSIENNLLSEQVARDGVEQSAMANAVHLTPVFVRVSQYCISLLLYISGFQILVRKLVTFR